MKENPNVLNSLNEFKSMRLELIYASWNRRKEIRQSALSCDTLMNYSYLVADITTSNWKSLEKEICAILMATNQDYLLESV